jgi:alginate O-acetyltransferase complex protein AlgI
MWGAPKFIVVILATIFINFQLAHTISRAEGSLRKFWLVIALLLNLGILQYFKYFNFFINNLNGMLTTLGYPCFQYTEVILPIGISFLTFHEISYVMDVYRKVKQPLHKITDFALYILLFPQLIAGPIIRFNEIADQLQDRRNHDTLDFKLQGFFRFIVGLSKKVLIANVLGAEVDKIFSLPSAELSTSIAWLGAIAYAFQIYFDFSGYSDMAIGIARMLGFIFPENFNCPYISQSITEFWQRWHMTLSRWMRDYLYIPLGGNRVTTPRLYFNLCLVFLVSGIWHGAAWTFLAWGIFHGFFLVLDRVILLQVFKRIGKFPSMTLTFLITLVGWVIFRSSSIKGAGHYLHKMFILDTRDCNVFLDTRFWAIMALATIISFARAFRTCEDIPLVVRPAPNCLSRYWVCTLGTLILLILSIGAVTSSEFNPFIYFRF